jgi:hypothetical protein
MNVTVLWNDVVRCRPSINSGPAVDVEVEAGPTARVSL